MFPLSRAPRLATARVDLDHDLVVRHDRLRFTSWLLLHMGQAVVVLAIVTLRAHSRYRSRWRRRHSPMRPGSHTSKVATRPEPAMNRVDSSHDLLVIRAARPPATAEKTSRSATRSRACRHVRGCAPRARSDQKPTPGH